MGFGEAVSMGLSKYATFAGRASRAEYWWFQAFLAAAYFGFVVLSFLGDTAAVIGLVLLLLFALATALPALSVLVRRLHDTDRSGWWYWIVVIPLVGGLILLVLTLLQGTPGPNRYGGGASAPARRH